MANGLDGIKRLTPSTKTQGKIIRILIVTVIILLGLGKTDVIELHSVVSLLGRNQPRMYRVARVDDGDTITVVRSGEADQVRLIGVDTPEIHHLKKPVQCYGPEAARFTKSITGDKVRLVADPLDDNRDIYGRLLRYVYTPDGTHINAEIIRNGYGFAYRHFPFRQKQRFISLEQTARLNNEGLWAGCRVVKDNRGAPQTRHNQHN